jgi:hypothetical protein
MSSKLKLSKNLKSNFFYESVDNFNQELTHIITGAIKYIEFYLHNIDFSSIVSNFDETIKNELCDILHTLKTYCIIYNLPITNLLTSSDSTNSDSTNCDKVIEYWAIFTSQWNLFVKYKLDGLYIFILSIRTFDKNELIITKEQTSIIYNTLLVLYPFNKDNLIHLIDFFELGVKTKSDILNDNFSSNLLDN